jgi:2-polyprenyl-3-methyl-5-hydroxy-6-metoxy-1,4-benzoquinol methylase
MRSAKPSDTDQNLSFAAPEFLWNSPGCTAVHREMLGPVLGRLRNAGSRSVLDLGCGNGAFTAEIRKAGFDVTGCDSSASGLSIARTHYSTIPFFQHDLSIPLGAEQAGRYDAVTAIEVIEHLLLPRLLVETARWALKPGGLLVVSTPFHGYWKNLALALTNKFDDHWHPLRDYGHVKFFSRKTLSRLFEECGLEELHFRQVGRIPGLARSMILAARKPR